MVSFEGYLRALKFWQEAPVKDKLGQIFDMFDVSETKKLDAAALQAILKSSQPDSANDTIASDASALMQCLDPKKQGYVTRSEFVDWFSGLPADELQQAFKIVFPSPPPANVP